MISYSIPIFHSFILMNYICTNVLFKGLPVVVDLSIYIILRQRCKESCIRIFPLGKCSRRSARTTQEQEEPKMSEEIKQNGDEIPILDISYASLIHVDIGNKKLAKLGEDLHKVSSNY